MVPCPLYLHRGQQQSPFMVPPPFLQGASDPKWHPISQLSAVPVLYLGTAPLLDGEGEQQQLHPLRRAPAAPHGEPPSRVSSTPHFCRRPASTPTAARGRPWFVATSSLSTWQVLDEMLQHEQQHEPNADHMFAVLPQGEISLLGSVCPLKLCCPYSHIFMMPGTTAMAQTQRQTMDQTAS
ncbi:hypothetical protein U9M48_004182 [Paspalum notatum var. saurae]|uniref:Uncharacterized protein n=1 Tax=Paspalum notatum var. saurae TaxID=547442 RepID=A0AAQ3PV33_PASNO